MRHTQILVLTALAVLLLAASCVTPSSSTLPTPNSQLNTPTRVPPTATPTATATHTPTPTATATPTATPTQIVITPCPTETLGGPSGQILFSADEWESGDSYGSTVSTLYLINNDGRAMQAIYTGKGAISNLQLSPDGTQLAFTDNHGREESDVYILNLVSGQAHPVLPDDTSLRSAGARWVSDQQLVYIARDAEPINSPSNIYLTNSQGTEIQQLTDRSFNTPYIGYMAISPDGSELLFSEFVSGSDAATIVYRMQIDGRDLSEMMTFKRMSGAHAYWSPSGETIIAYAKPLKSGEPTPLYSIKSDSSEIRKLAELPGIPKFLGWTEEPEQPILYVSSGILGSNQIGAVQNDGNFHLLAIGKGKIPGGSLGRLSPNQNQFAFAPFPLEGLFVLDISNGCHYQIISGYGVQDLLWLPEDANLQGIHQ